MTVRRLSIRLVALSLAAACTSSASMLPRSTPSATTASAVLRDQTGKQVGSVTLTDTYAGVLLSGTVNGLGIGAHGIHLHEVGRCEAPFTTAGGHINPDKHKHGYKNPDGYHRGDLPNIELPPTGDLKFEIVAPGLTLGGSNGLLDSDGSAIVIHGARDDYMTDPAGNSGSRIVCGVITAR